MTPAPANRFLLFVVGETITSRIAQANAPALMADNLDEGSYELEIIDLSQRPELAGEYDLVATPTLVRLAPEPRQSFIGDLSAPYLAQVILVAVKPHADSSSSGGGQ